jgi:hypothetical protein
MEKLDSDAEGAAIWFQEDRDDVWTTRVSLKYCRKSEISSI